MKENKNKIDKEMEKLMGEMDKFDENYRRKVCDALKDHEAVHTHVITYPSGVTYCDQLRNAKSRKFRQRSSELLSMVADSQQ